MSAVLMILSTRRYITVQLELLDIRKMENKSYLITCMKDLFKEEIKYRNQLKNCNIMALVGI